MDLLVIIFSAAALLGVVISLVAFVQKFPNSERLAVIGLLASGALLLLVVSISVSTKVTTDSHRTELCDAVNGNRAAITSLIIALERQGAENSDLRRAEELIDGPVC